MSVVRSTRGYRGGGDYNRFRRAMPSALKKKYNSRRSRQSTRVPRQPSASEHFFKRTYTQEVTTTSGVIGLGREWQLALLPNYTEITALFDQYRINCVVVRVIWRSSGLSQIETANNNVAGMPIMYDVIDLDDSTAAASAAEIQEYSKHHITPFGTNRRTRSLKVYPRTANTVYRTGATSAYGMARRKQWIDCSYADVPYYGWKSWIDVPQGGGTAQEASFDLHFTVYLQCRQSR